MLSNITKIEIKMSDRVYHFLCEVDSPLGEVHDALSTMKGFIIEKMKEYEKLIEDSKKEEANG